MATKETLITLMPARNLVNPVLGALILAAAALLLLTEYESAPQQRSVSELDTGAVDRIIVERDDGSDLIFRKDGDDWFLIEPVHIRARPARVEAVLRLPSTVSRERIAAAEADLATMHLAPPLLKLRIGEQSFHLGGTDPINNHRYILEGQTVHLIDDRLFHQLTQPVSFYTHVQLLPDDAVVTQITYPNHTILLDGNRWHSSPGAVLPGTETAVLVENWRQAEAQRVLPYRNIKAAGKVIIKTTGKVMVFDIVSANHGLLLARSDLGLQYQLSPDTASSLGLAGYLRE